MFVKCIYKVILMLTIVLASFSVKGQRQQVDPNTYNNFKQMFITPVYHFILKVSYLNGKYEVLTIESFDIKMDQKRKRIMMLGDYGDWSPAVNKVRTYKLIRKIRIN